VERGVRFVQLFNGAYASMGRLNWDGHGQLKDQYDIHGEILDQPVAGLLKDLKQRGLLEDTLVVFATEFGRMPMFQMGTLGRDHNPYGFTCWLAGAGVRPGVSYGRTDEFGFKAVEDVTTPHDFHATILHLLGLDHERLTYYHNGIERRLTNVHGHVIRDILS
jgi:arylsulfatase A-like enzyme